VSRRRETDAQRFDRLAHAAFLAYQRLVDEGRGQSAPAMLLKGQLNLIPEYAEAVKS
jgi:hypothetical protein